MAEIVFNNDMQSFLNTLETHMVESIYEYINNKKAGITYKTIDSIRNNLNGFKDSQVSSLSDSSIEQKVEQYFDELKEFEQNHIQKIIESVRQVTDSVIHQAEKKSERELESTFTFLVNEINRRQNVTLYDELNYEFSSNLVSFLTSKYDYDYRLAQAISDVQNEIKHILDRLSDDVIVEFQDNLKGFSRYYIERTLEAMNEQIKENKENKETHTKEDKVPEAEPMIKGNGLFVSSDDIAKYSSLASKMGLHIEETFDGYIIQAPQSDEKEFLYKDENDNLYTESHAIELNDSHGILIKLGDKVIVEENDTVYFGTVDNVNKISLTTDFLEYEIRYAGNVQTDPLKKGAVLSYIARNYPEYYHNLSRDALFQALEQEISAADNKAEELYKDAYGTVHINKNNAELFQDKIGALGYRAIEKDNGVYLIDRKGIEHHLLYESGYAFLEDEPMVGFNTNQIVISDTEIRGPRIDYHKADINLSIASDYMDLSLTGPNQSFFIGYGPDKKFKCVGNNAGTRIANAEVVTFLNRFCPEALEKVKNACLSYEAELKKRASSTIKEESSVDNTPVKNTQETPSVEENNSQLEKETEDLIQELDTEILEQTQQSEFQDIATMDVESIYQEMSELQQNPHVARYISLLEVINNRYQSAIDNQEKSEDNSHKFK